MLGLVEAERAFTPSIRRRLPPPRALLRVGVSTSRSGGRSSPASTATVHAAEKETEIYIERIREQRQVAGSSLNFGEVSVTEQ